MLHRIAATGALAAALVALSPSVSAGGTAWSVSIGLPGFAISAGQPGYWGGTPNAFVGIGVGYGGYGYGGYGYRGYGYRGYGYGEYGYPGYGHGRGHVYRPAYQPHYGPYYALPVVPVPVYPAPVTYVAPYAYGAPVASAVRVAPVPYGTRVYAPRRAYVSTPVPPAVRYGRY